MPKFYVLYGDGLHEETWPEEDKELAIAEFNDSVGENPDITFVLLLESRTEILRHDRILPTNQNNLTKKLRGGPATAAQQKEAPAVVLERIVGLKRCLTGNGFNGFNLRRLI